MAGKYVGKRYLHGLHDQAGSPTIGTLTYKTTDGSTTITGYVSPNLRTLRLTQNNEVDRVKNQLGEYNGLIGSGEFLECEFTYVLEGANLTNAQKSGLLPPVLAGCIVAGLPVIVVGDFADALNTPGALPSVTPWIYEGGGSVSLEAESKATGTVTLRRYTGITSAATIA